MSPARVTRSARFLRALARFDEVLIVTHDNPDPDAIASGWALLYLIEQRLQKPVRLIGGGDIIRAENRHMVKLLEPPIDLVRQAAAGSSTAIVLIDCAAESHNHLFPGSLVTPVAVIDHHLAERRTIKAEYEDIRPRAVASATIAAGYLREQGLEPSARLASALVYAVRTETRGNETYYSRMDRTVLVWLTRFVDPAAVAEIENAPLSFEYFGDLALALQGTFIYGDTALCLLPRASGPEIVGEVADMLIRCEGLRRVLCGAMVQGDVILSVRTVREGDDAAKLVRETVKGLGYGGGHRHRAGGKIPSHGRSKAAVELLQDELLSRWLVTCGIDQQRGRHLIARQEIVQNL